MKLAITLKKSPIASLEKQPDNACVRGMIFVVKHMVDVAQVEE